MIEPAVGLVHQISLHLAGARERGTLAREGETFDCVFLDHDLEGETFVTAIEGSGTEVAHFIRDHLPALRCPRSVVVHSLNPDGAAATSYGLSGNSAS